MASTIGQLERLAVSIALLACAACSSTPSVQLTTATPTIGSSATPQASEASTGAVGGPVPPALAGVWHLSARGATMTLEGTGYAIETTDPPGGLLGNATVLGDEIDFFAEGGCALKPPAGIGRYRWQVLSGTSLLFTPLNEDICSRAGFLASQTWTRTPASS